MDPFEREGGGLMENVLTALPRLKKRKELPDELPSVYDLLDNHDKYAHFESNHTNTGEEEMDLLRDGVQRSSSGHIHLLTNVPDKKHDNSYNIRHGFKSF